MKKHYGPFWAALFALLLVASACGDSEQAGDIEAAGSQELSDGGSDGEAITATATVEVDPADATDMAMGDDETTAEPDGESDGGHAHAGAGELMDMPASDADVVITARLADGDLQIDDRRFKILTGSTVGVALQSDIDEVVHVHGYDLLVPVGPGRPIDMSFLADSPGTFEVEFESSGRFLFEIQVN